jgi:hypothetical protein
LLFVVTIAVKLPAADGLVENVTVKEVAVAAVTVPTAPLLNTTVFCEAVVLNARPLIVTVLTFAARPAVLTETDGTTDATTTDAPLDTPFVTTIADRFPTDVGRVVSDTVSAVAVAADTEPTAPLLKVTALLASVVSNPLPMIVSVVALALSTLPELARTTGVTVATWVAEPLVSVFVVTMAVRLPAFEGFVVRVTVSVVAVAEAIVPTAPLFKVTELLAAVGSKPNPLIVSVDAFANRLAVLLVTTGVIWATCTAEPLFWLLVVAITVRLPAVAGRVENVTVSDVLVAEVTVPTALLFRTTVFRDAIGSNPKPLIVTVLELAAKAAVLLVMTGLTVAT